MCGSDELIHDARQVDLEEMIMTNETPMYLVPGELTAEQARLVGPLMAHDWEMIVQYAGVPIQPCADVKTVAWQVENINYGQLFYSEKSARERGKAFGGIVEPLVRRTDMEAQVARVAAEKDAVIAHLWQALTSIATDTSMTDLWDLREVARAALNEGAAG